MSVCRMDDAGLGGRGYVPAGWISVLPAPVLASRRYRPARVIDGRVAIGTLPYRVPDAGDLPVASPAAGLCVGLRIGTHVPPTRPRNGKWAAVSVVREDALSLWLPISIDWGTTVTRHLDGVPGWTMGHLDRSSRPLMTPDLSQVIDLPPMSSLRANLLGNLSGLIAGSFRRCHW